MTVPHSDVLAPVVVTGVALLAMTITSADIVDVLGALGILAAAIAAAYSLIIAARMKVIAATSAETLDKVNVVEGHVNSAATKAEGIIAGQATQLEMQRETIAELKRAAALLAQATATQSTQSLIAGVPPPVVGAPAEHSLKQIDTNTAKIEQNTARTDATVQDLKKP